jgi:peptidoglycan/xylan/chitin deacetylase (PgdA/CDA1 family)
MGAVRVSVQARDAAGNRTEAAPVVVSLPGRRAPVRVITEVRTSRPLVALTIDDGYDASAMDSMIATATRMRAPVTMCINGSAASGYSAGLRARLQRATAAGWVQTCSHGYSHGIGSRMSYSQAYRDLQTNVVWDRATGQSSVPFYRPPYGDIGGNLLSAATDLRYRYALLWDVDTNDWRHRSTGTTISHVLGNASRGSIVLMHAIPSSAAALPSIISGLRARGLEPVAIGDLIAAGRPVR